VNLARLNQVVIFNFVFVVILAVILAVVFLR